MDLERYQIVQGFASGRDVRSWKAVDRVSDRLVHIKELNLEHVDSWKAVELFEREVSALQQLDHPQIPGLVDSWNEAEAGAARFGVAREWVDGTPLDAGFADIEPMSDAEIRNVLTNVAAILEYLHAFRPPIVHRDLTPEHIIRDDEGRIHLVGFGGVQAALPKTQGGSTFVGTSGYVAPEQLMGKAQPASDIYALGATCAALLAGIPAADLPSSQMRVRFEDHVEATPALVALLQHMLDPMVDGRPADGGKLVRRLASLDKHLTRYEARILDDPPPDALKVRLTDDRLQVWPHVNIRRSGLVQGIAIATVMIMVFIAVATALYGYSSSLVDLASIGIFFGMLFAIALMPSLLLPYAVRMDRERIYSRPWLRSIALDDVEEIEVSSGANPLTIWADGRPHMVRLPMSPNEAEWVADRIRERMKARDE